jgi:hypothetical protein
MEVKRGSVWFGLADLSYKSQTDIKGKYSYKSGKKPIYFRNYNSKVVAPVGGESPLELSKHLLAFT